MSEFESSVFLFALHPIRVCCWFCPDQSFADVVCNKISFRDPACDVCNIRQVPCLLQQIQKLGETFKFLLTEPRKSGNTYGVLVVK